MLAQENMAVKKRINFSLPLFRWCFRGSHPRQYCPGVFFVNKPVSSANGAQEPQPYNNYRTPTSNTAISSPSKMVACSSRSSVVR